jgi:hypothetical protein
MEERVYSDDLIEGTLKKLLIDYCCTDCGLVPHYGLSLPGSNGFKMSLEMKGWDRVDNMVKCPLCLRIIKIKRLKKIKV